MDELLCISFDDDIKILDDEEGTYVKIKIGNKEFGVCVEENEAEKAFKKYKAIVDCQYSTVEVVLALRKLANFIETTVNMDIPKNLVE